MFDRSPVPLLRVSHLKPFIVAIEALGGPVERLLRDAQLPVLIRDDLDQVVPERFVWNLTALAARRTGAEDFGLRVARTSPVWRSEPAVVTAMTQMPTLRAGLDFFRRLARRVNTGPGYRLLQVDDKRVFCHLNWAGVDGQDQIDLYTLLMMTQVVQCTTGHAWWPAEIYARAANAKRLAATQEFSHCHIRTSESFTGIVIPDTLLAGPMVRLAAPAGAHDLSAPLDMGLLDAMRLALRPYLAAGRPGIGLAAEIAGSSERTFQRRLAALDITYSDLLDRVRFDEARSRLNGPDASITDIGFDLGFSDVAHFSRAFRRWSGMSPRQYRQRNLRECRGTA